MLGDLLDNAGDLLDDGRYDAVLANLPYVADGAELPPEVAVYEPAGALFGGPDGLDLIRRLVALVAPRSEVSVLALEIGFDQADAVAALVAGAGFTSVSRLRDLAGHERVVVRSTLSVPAGTHTAAFERAIAAGGVVLFPSDTVYGLACDPFNAAAISWLYSLKGRSPAKAAAVMFFDLEVALAAVPELGEWTRGALRRLMPGAVTALCAESRGTFPACLR